MPKNMTREDILKKVQNNGLDFGELEEQFRNDKEIAVAALVNFPYKLPYVLSSLGEELKQDQDAIKDIVLEAVKQLGSYIRYSIPEHLQKDPQIVDAINRAGEIQDEHRNRSLQQKVAAEGKPWTKEQSENLERLIAEFLKKQKVAAEGKPWTKEQSEDLVRLIAEFFKKYPILNKATASPVTGGASASVLQGSQVFFRG